MSANLGDCTLSRRRKSGNPMRDFDTLPPMLRRWMAQATLPWSPRSCRRIWLAERRAGGSDADALARLERAEAATLRRDRGASLVC